MFDSVQFFKNLVLFLICFFFFLYCSFFTYCELFLLFFFKMNGNKVVYTIVFFFFMFVSVLYVGVDCILIAISRLMKNGKMGSLMYFVWMI